MSEYIHHVSGRLRLKLAQIRKQPRRAQEVQTAVCRIKGITAVETNVVTGSLLIRYDVAEVDVESILSSMRGMGLLSATDTRRTEGQFSVSMLTDKMLDVAVEKLIERSAIAIVGALL